MIVVDTSAVIAVLLGESDGARIAEVLETTECVMSAATRVEVGIVIEARSGPAGTLLLEELLRRVQIEVVDVDESLAADAVVAWRRYGRGRHPAGLNYGDTFAYALARRLDAPLLFVGDDFRHTDVVAA